MAVAIVITSGASTTFPASSNHAANCANGSSARSSSLKGWASVTCDIVTPMAVTRTIDIRTDIPGPRSKEILDRKEQVVAEPLSIYLPVVIARGTRGHDHRRRRQHLHRLHRGRRLPERRALASARGRRRAGAAREVQPHRLHDRPVRGLRRAVRTADRADPDLGREKRAAFFNAGTEAVENSIKFARSYTKRPAVICVRRSLPRPDDAVDDDDLQDAPVQGRPWPVRPRGLPRPVPALVSRAGRGGPLWLRSSARSSRRSHPRTWPPLVIEPAARRGRVRRRALRVPLRACASSGRARDRPRRRRGADRLRADGENVGDRAPRASRRT